MSKGVLRYMNNKINKIFLLSALLTVLAVPSAYAGVKFSVFGVGTDSNLKDGTLSATQTDTAVLSYGGGAQLEFPLGPRLGLEIGGVYLPRTFKFADSSIPLSFNITLNYVQIPVQFRIWLSRIMNIGLGGYYAVGTGTSVGGVSGNFSDFNYKTSDYGVLGSVGFNFPLGSSVGLLVEGRYALGLADIQSTPNPAGTTKWSDIQGIVGLRFGMR